MQAFVQMNVQALCTITIVVDAAEDPGAVPDEWTAAAELAPMTEVWHRLLEDHVPNSAGRCRACTQGGTGIPTARWPCGPRKVAEAAARCSSGRAAPSTGHVPR